MQIKTGIAHDKRRAFIIVETHLEIQVRSPSGYYLSSVAAVESSTDRRNELAGYPSRRLAGSDRR
jgi:hypothetical protein